ncbi:ComEA family DNA-binding protein [Adhaeribacter terreus]|uniref:ComEA family DNA-binding protein n=1 Tax=Adhaeribacter terreus TaxID=529703 RepID=A0ABW0ED23_9BACT
MPKPILFTLFFLPFFLAFAAQAQEFPRREVNLDLFVQELFSQQQDKDLPYEDIYENLLQFYQNPINLNRANREELSSLFILSEVQITALFEHINRTGGLLSIYELQTIEGFDLITINKLLPFVTVQEMGLQADRRPIWERIRAEDNNYLLVRYERSLQEKKGYLQPTIKSNGQETSHYKGSPDKLLMRYRVAHTRDFSLGFTLEKDAGEQFIFDDKTHRYGFDFYSGHFQLYDKGRLKTLAVGDYQLSFGQGLVSASAFGVGKGGETITTTRRSDLGIRPYTSTLESAFFRGAAATYALTNTLNLTGFYSRKKVDVSFQLLQDSLDQLNEQISLGDLESSSLQETGFHRTDTEIARKHNVTEQISGANLAYFSKSRRASGGFTVFNSSYSVPLLRSDAAYNRFEFRGRNNLLLSGYYSYNWRNVNFFGEAARSQSGGLGLVQGLMASLTPQVEVALLYRNYARDFHTLYGDGFSENTRPINEKGFYTGLKIRPASRWELTAYYDRYRFPWLRYGVNAPSGGDEYLLRLLYKPSKLATIYGQFRTENKELEEPESLQQIPGLTLATRRNYLLSADFAPTGRLSLRSRLQFSSYNLEHGERTTGYLLAQDVNLEFKRFRIGSRYAVFDTDDSENRQYVTEKDVLYAFSIPSFSGLGTRIYTVLQYSFSRKMDVWLKLAHTHYRYQKTISSGLEEIQGSRRTDVRAQVRYRF